MPMIEQVPMSRTSMTIVAVVVLCAAGFAYSQGWFNWSNSSSGVESDRVGTEQLIDQKNTNEAISPVAQQTTEPDATQLE